MADEVQTAPKLTPRITRSRCFRIFKWTLFIAVLGMALLTLASVPWCLSLTRELLAELTKNDTSFSAMYATDSAAPLVVTDELVYIVVGVSVVLTLLYLLFGAIAALKESFCMSVVFGLSLLLGFAGKHPCTINCRRCTALSQRPINLVVRLASLSSPSLVLVGSIFYIQHLLFVINMAIDLVLGLLFILYGIAIKVSLANYQRARTLAH